MAWNLVSNDVSKSGVLISEEDLARGQNPRAFAFLNSSNLFFIHFKNFTNQLLRSLKMFSKVISTRNINKNITNA